MYVQLTLKVETFRTVGKTTASNLFQRRQVRLNAKGKHESLLFGIRATSGRVDGDTDYMEHLC